VPKQLVKTAVPKQLVKTAVLKTDCCLNGFSGGES